MTIPIFIGSLFIIIGVTGAIIGVILIRDSHFQKKEEDKILDFIDKLKTNPLPPILAIHSPYLRRWNDRGVLLACLVNTKGEENNVYEPTRP